MELKTTVTSLVNKLFHQQATSQVIEKKFDKINPYLIKEIITGKNQDFNNHLIAEFAKHIKPNIPRLLENSKTPKQLFDICMALWDEILEHCQLSSDNDGLLEELEDWDLKSWQIKVIEHIANFKSTHPNQVLEYRYVENLLKASQFVNLI